MTYYGETNKYGIPDGTGAWIDSKGTVTWQGIWKDGIKYTGYGSLYDHDGKLYYSGGIKKFKYDGNGIESSDNVKKFFKDGNYHGTWYKLGEEISWKDGYKNGYNFLSHFYRWYGWFDMGTPDGIFMSIFRSEDIIYFKNNQKLNRIEFITYLSNLLNLPNDLSEIVLSYLGRYNDDNSIVINTEKNMGKELCIQSPSSNPTLL